MNNEFIAKYVFFRKNNKEIKYVRLTFTVLKFVHDIALYLNLIKYPYVNILNILNF